MLIENKLVIEKLYGTLMAHGDVASAENLLSGNYVDHDIPGIGSGGRKELFAAVLGVRAAFPDIQPELYQLVAENDLVSVRVEASGTHTGTSFLGVAPAGKKIRWKEIHIFRCHSGKIVEHWGVFDLLSIYMQLGIMKP